MQSEAKMRPLDLSNLLRHAFISGFQSMGGTITAACGHWPQYDPETCSAYHRVSAALSDKQAGEVKIKPLEWVPIVEGGRDIQAKTEFGLYTISIDSSFAGGTHYLWTPDQREFDDDHHSDYRSRSAALNAAQADYEQRIRSALVDVPAVEPVAGYRRRLPQYAFEHYEFEQPGYENPSISDWEPLYTSPPLTREGEDSTEVIEKEIASVVQSVNEWDDRTSPDDYPEHLLITSDELADILRNFSAALAATRSGSATAQKGIPE